jgi:hypothetical protein
MVAISISNEKIPDTRSYNLNQRGALPPFDSNAYLIAESLLSSKAHCTQNRSLNVFNPDYGLLERPDKMISYLLQASHSVQGDTPFSKVEFHNYSKNKNQDKPSNVNLYSIFMSSAVRNRLKKVEEEYTIVFTAHHDIVNSYSDNIQDNLASCCHLIALNKRICNYLASGGLLYHNIMIAILDEEESGMGGSKALANVLRATDRYGKIGLILNLELTARGTHYWIDQSYNSASMVFKEAVKNHTCSTYANINCPPNDAMPLRTAGYNAACIGTLTRKEMKKVLSKSEPIPHIWSICHKNEDKFIYANEHDMDYFTSLLFKISTNEWSSEIDKGILNNKPYGSINYKNKKITTTAKSNTYVSDASISVGYPYKDLTFSGTTPSQSTSKTNSRSKSLIKNGKFDYFTGTELTKEINYWSELFSNNTDCLTSIAPTSEPKKQPSIDLKSNTQANGFFKSNLESRISFLNLKDDNIPVMKDLMSRGKFISELDFLMYKKVNPDLADFYMSNLKDTPNSAFSSIYNHTFYDPNIRHTLDAVRKYCSNEEDFYYMGLLGIKPISLSSQFGMNELEYFAFIAGHAIRIIDIDRDLKSHGHQSKADESYNLSFDDIFLTLIGTSCVMSDPSLLSNEFSTDDKFYCFTEDIAWPFITTYISMLISDDDFMIDTDINFAKLSSATLNKTLFKDFNSSFFRDMFAYFYECNFTSSDSSLTPPSFAFDKKSFEAGFYDGQKGGQLLKHVVSKPGFAPEKVLGFSLGRVYDQVVSYEQSSKELLDAITSRNHNKCNEFFREALGIWADSIDHYLDYCSTNNKRNKETYIHFASLCPEALADRIRLKFKFESKPPVIDLLDDDIIIEKVPLNEIKQLTLPVETFVDSVVDTSILPNLIEKTFTSLNSLASKVGKLL